MDRLDRKDVAEFARHAISSSEHSSSEEEMSESEQSFDQAANTGKSMTERPLHNQPFDEAMDLSDSEESVSDRDEKPKILEQTFKNQTYDEAFELSGSMHELDSPVKNISKQVQKPSVEAHSSTTKPGELKNNPFDEEIDVSDSAESLPSPSSETVQNKQMFGGPEKKVSVSLATQSVHAEEKPRDVPLRSSGAKTSTPSESVKNTMPSSSSSSSSSESSESAEEDEEAQSGTDARANLPSSASTSAVSAPSSLFAAVEYKESDFAHLKVSSDVRELFQYITRFKAQEIELEARLRCFIPDYIPAIGEMDPFLKIPRPDGQADHLGLKLLDEPSLAQSDATVLDLQLRSNSKKKHGDLVVRSIENAEKSSAEIDRWIKSITDLHRTKPPPHVHYTKAMPEVEALMQLWPESFEEILGKTALPSSTMDLSLDQYARVICALLDIPVHKNLHESLHLLFTLYLEFRDNQHFVRYEEPIPSASTAQRPRTGQ